MVFILVNMTFCYFKRHFNHFSVKKTRSKTNNGNRLPAIAVAVFGMDFDYGMMLAQLAIFTAAAVK